LFFSPPTTECYTVPGAPPRNVTGKAISPTSILVTWEPPIAERSNGRIAYYRLQVVESGRSDSEARNIKLNDTRFVLDELKKWTEYRIWVLAGTRVGDGPPSYPILVRTHEDGMYHRHWLKVSLFTSGTRGVTCKIRGDTLREKVNTTFSNIPIDRERYDLDVYIIEQKCERS